MFNPFFDNAERRVRALWRILIHGLLFLLFSGLFSYVVMAAVSAGAGLPFNPASQDWAQAAMMQLNSSPVGRVMAIIAGVLAVLAALMIAGRWLDRRPLADFGFHFNRNWWIDFGFGLALGAVLMALIFLAELAAGWVEVTGYFWVSAKTIVPFGVVTLIALTNYVAVGINEEIISRGYHLRNLAEGLRLWRFSPKTALLIGYVLSSSMFGLFHLNNPNTTWVSTVNLILTGLFLGLGYVLTGELAIPIGLHITWNFFQGRVFGFPVSGGATNSSFIAIRQLGPDVMTGGAFGPEAGLLGLAAVTTGCVLTVLWVKWRHGQAEAQASLASYAPRGKVAAADLQVAEEGI